MITMSPGFSVGAREGLGIGGETLSVHGAVDDHGGGQAVEAQARDQRRGFPMAMRQRGTAAVAARGAPTQAGHLCGCASLVEEHQPCRIEIWLKGEPSLAPDFSHPRALVRWRGQSFFKRHLVAAVESVECADCKALAPLGD